jgi:hypothetical protein
MHDFNVGPRCGHAPRPHRRVRTFSAVAPPPNSTSATSLVSFVLQTNHLLAHGIGGRTGALKTRWFGSTPESDPTAAVLGLTYSFLGRRLRIRTPGPPPFSSRNSTPAVSKANRILVPVSSRPPNGPSLASKRLIVGNDTSAAAASCSCDQAKSERAALTCLIDTFSIDLEVMACDTISIERRSRPS